MVKVPPLTKTHTAPMRETSSVVPAGQPISAKAVLMVLLELGLVHAQRLP